jgi:hypothetical protein
VERLFVAGHSQKMDRQECLSYSAGEMTVRYQNVQEIEAVVAGFEDYTTSKDAFTHSSHLTVGAYYLLNSPPSVAFEKMRAGLLRFLDHHSVDCAKYNEQVTRAWLEQIQNVIEQSGSDASLVWLTNAVLEQLSAFRLPIEATSEVDPKS